mmetsp:Transcript_34055/g.25140  ORF Transcript_34055/g.25140 Transcript_34055/m.25140 type:complete len:98 (+) Transcript_34055:58-351(+)
MNSKTDTCIALFPYNLNTHRQIAAYKINESQIRIFVKGSPESILNMCTHMSTLEGKIAYFEDQATKEKIKENTLKLTREEGMKVVVYAYKDIASDSF